MTRITSLDLNPFYRNSIGFNQLFDRITSNIDTATQQNYPPYNIIRKDDEHYFIEIAAAGFLKPDIAITLENGTLTITGNQTKDVDGMDEADGYEYLHKGLAGRNFTRQFTMAEHVEVKDASLNNGILLIHLEKIIPEALKPRNIQIT